jgi:hypothetical protein
LILVFPDINSLRLVRHDSDVLANGVYTRVDKLPSASVKMDSA